jgi:hypothetical protein
MGRKSEEGISTLQRSLARTSQSHRIVAEELRRMAEGEDEYDFFAGAAPTVLNVLRAAAGLLDPQAENELKEEN